MSIGTFSRYKIVNKRVEFLEIRCVPGGKGYRASHYPPGYLPDFRINRFAAYLMWYNHGIVDAGITTALSGVETEVTINVSTIIRAARKFALAVLNEAPPRLKRKASIK
jgi:hypothetical protein